MALELVQFNNPFDLRYSQTVEVVKNFLSREVLDEPYNPFPEDPVPLLFGTVDDGKLVAAASLRPYCERHFFVGLLGVASDRRGAGLGSELLKGIEKQVVRLGALALVVDPVGNLRANSQQDARGFFMHRGYAPHPNGDPDLLVKMLPERGP